MKLPVVTLLLLSLAQTVAGFALGASEGRRASWDDVNVVAHGLLQLGQGLKEHVERSKAQMGDLNAKLRGLNATLAALDRKQREQEGAPVAGGPQGAPAPDLGLALEEARKQGRDLLSRMDALEEKVQRASDGQVPAIQQGTVAAQNRRIEQLADKIKQQQEKLEKQSLHLQALQSKVAHKRLKSHRRRDGEATLRGQHTQTQSHATSGLFRDCHDLFTHGQRASGVYTIQPGDSLPFDVLCEMTAEGGWTVIQKRLDGSQSFNQLWEDYKNGFGSLTGDFWLGLESIHAVSSQGPQLLQVELTSQTGQTHTARYRAQIDGEENKFALSLEPEASAGAQEEILPRPTSALAFSTADSDNDLAADANCARLLSGGWWFSGCGASNINGKYPGRASLRRRQHPRRQWMFWTDKDGRILPLKATTLKMAPVTIQQ